MGVLSQSSGGRGNRGREKVVCVMDASTHVGFCLVQGLLHRGYFVNAAVSKKPGDIEVDPLRNINGEALRIYYVDVLDYHSITKALQNSEALFYNFDSSQSTAGYQEWAAELEVQAAHNALEACAQIPSIQKVVFTSSVSAIVWTENDAANPGMVFDERHWSDTNMCRKLKLWHALTKTSSERAAWALAMDRGLDMISINAALPLGPGLLPVPRTAAGSTISYLKGAGQMYEKGVLATVEMKYLVEAHICALEHSDAYGRYICYTHIINSAETAVGLAQSLHPLIQFPDRCEDDAVYAHGLSNKKLQSLLTLHETCVSNSADGSAEFVGHQIANV